MKKKEGKEGGRKERRKKRWKEGRIEKYRERESKYNNVFSL